jgi:hypothetical protein
MDDGTDLKIKRDEDGAYGGDWKLYIDEHGIPELHLTLNSGGHLIVLPFSPASFEVEGCRVDIQLSYSQRPGEPRKDESGQTSDPPDTDEFPDEIDT